MFMSFFRIVEHHYGKCLNSPFPRHMALLWRTAFIRSLSHLCETQCSVGMRQDKILIFFFRLRISFHTNAIGSVWKHYAIVDPWVDQKGNFIIVWTNVQNSQKAAWTSLWFLFILYWGARTFHWHVSNISTRDNNRWYHLKPMLNTIHVFFRILSSQWLVTAIPLQ